MTPDALKVMLLPAEESLPFSVMPPVFVTKTVPVPVCERPVNRQWCCGIREGNRCLHRYLKHSRSLTTFASLKVVPVTELVVNVPVVLIVPDV